MRAGAGPVQCVERIASDGSRTDIGLVQNWKWQYRLRLVQGDIETSEEALRKESALCNLRTPQLVTITARLALASDEKP